MRTLFLALALASLPAAAQAPSDSLSAYPLSLRPGLFVETAAGVGYGGGSVGIIGATRASVGYRLSNGVSLGATAAAASYGTDAAALSLGPDLRLNRSLDSRTTLDLRLSGSAGFAEVGQRTGLRATGLGSLAEASATQRFRVGGVTLAATGGVYGGVARTFALDGSADASFPGRRAATHADAGLLIGLQAEFRGLGGRFAVGPLVPVSIISTRPVGLFGSQAYQGALRTPGLVTYTGKRFSVSLF